MLQFQDLVRHRCRERPDRSENPGLRERREVPRPSSPLRLQSLQGAPLGNALLALTCGSLAVPSSPLLPWLTQSPHEGSRALGVNQASQSLVNLPAEMDPCLWGSSLTTPGEHPSKQAGTPPGFSPLPLYLQTQGSQQGCAPAAAGPGLPGSTHCCNN